MEYAIGIDLGGTHIKVVAVTPTGEILRKLSRETKDSDATAIDTEAAALPSANVLHRSSLEGCAPAQLLKQLDSSLEPSSAIATAAATGAATAVGPALQNSSLEAPSWALEVQQIVDSLSVELNAAPAFVGLCAPGLASSDKRSIAFMPGRMSGLEGFDWTQFLLHSKQVQVVNDAHAALMGEVWKGSAKGLHSVVMLTLGTGVGGAILHDGRLMKGQIGRAGSFGHICLNPDRPADDTRMPGSLENAIGDRSVAARSGGKFSSTKELVNAAASGDDFAKDVWIRSVRELACGIGSIINILDPQAVIIGGGISRAGEDLLVPLRNELSQVEWRPNDCCVPIIPAALGEWSGAFGAAYYAIDET